MCQIKDLKNSLIQIEVKIQNLKNSKLVNKLTKDPVRNILYKGEARSSRSAHAWQVKQLPRISQIKVAMNPKATVQGES